jgi:hypothetical protein
MLTIKVLGSGCANCKRVEQIARKIITDMGIEAEVIKVTGYNVMAYNILSAVWLSMKGCFNGTSQRQPKPPAGECTSSRIAAISVIL